MSVVDTSLIIFAVGKIKGSNTSLDLPTNSPLIFLSVFCFVQETGFGLIKSIPCPKYLLVSTLSEKAILNAILSSWVIVFSISLLLITWRVSPTLIVGLTLSTELASVPSTPL